jgi:hypothetical protein
MGLISHCAKLQYHKWAKWDRYKMQWDKFLRLKNAKIYYNIGTKLDYVYCK